MTVPVVESWVRAERLTWLDGDLLMAVAPITAGVQVWDCGCDDITTAARRRTYVRDDQGRFDDIPGGGGTADRLKLGSRISLGPGETLVSSKKIRSDPEHWDLLAAQVDTPAGRELRLGVIWAEDVKNWAAGPNPKRQARLEAIDEEIERLEAMEEAEFSDADFERMEALEEERADLAGFDDEELNRTVVLNTQSVRQLRSELGAGVQHARTWSEQQNEFWDAHADLADEDFELNNLERSQGLTPEQQDRRRAIRQVLDAAGDPDVILAEGSVPGGVEGDLVYRIAGTDDGEGGWDLSLGIRDVDADWMLGGEDDKAVFEPKDVDRLLRELATLGGDGATVAAVVWGCGCPTTAAKDVIVRDGHSITVNRDGQGQFAEKADADLSKLKVPELRKLATARGLKGLSKATKPQLVEALKTGEISPLKTAAPAKVKAPAKPRVRKVKPPTPAQGATQRSKLRKLAKQVPTSSRNFDDQGIGGQTTERTWADGTKAVDKTHDYRNAWIRDIGELTDAEELAALVGHAVGARVPAVIRTGPNRIRMQHVNGDPGHVAKPDLSLADLPGSEDGRLIGLLDVLIANPDRSYAKNWMLGADGKVWGIDHGSAFGAASPEYGHNPWADHFLIGDTIGIDPPPQPENDMSPSDMALIRKRLEALKPAFAELGRGDWHEAMMQRLDMVESQARGTKSRLS